MSIDNINWKLNNNISNKITKDNNDVVDNKENSKEEPSFFDFLLDTINPLQHIPFINTAYRDITGDEMTSGSRVFGGFLFGGPIGAVVGLFSSVFEESTGKAPDKMLADAIFDNDKEIKKELIVENDKLNQTILNRHINETYGEGLDINHTQVALNTNENMKSFEINRGENAIEVAGNKQFIQTQMNENQKNLLKATEETPDEMIQRIMIENKIKETYN